VVALDPALHLGASFAQRLRDRGDVAPVLLEKRADFLAPLAVSLRQSLPERI